MNSNTTLIFWLLDLEVVQALLAAPAALPMTSDVRHLATMMAVDVREVPAVLQATVKKSVVMKGITVAGQSIMAEDRWHNLGVPRF